MFIHFFFWGGKNLEISSTKTDYLKVVLQFQVLCDFSQPGHLFSVISLSLSRQNAKLHVNLLKREIFYFSISRLQDSASLFLIPSFYTLLENTLGGWGEGVSVGKYTYFGARVQFLRVRRIKLGCVKSKWFLKQSLLSNPFNTI